MPVYKDEKRNTWYVRLRYKDYTGKWHATTKRGFTTKREAKQYEAEQQAAVNAPQTMTLRTLSEKFMQDAAQRRKDSTLRTYDFGLRYLLRYLGDKSICDITPHVIREWQNELLGFRSTNGRALSKSSLASITGTASMLFNYAVRYYGLPSNPVRITGKLGTVERRSAFWDENQFKQFLAQIPETGRYKWDRLYFSLLYATGIRLGEFLALSLSDFDFAANTISISKTIDQATQRIGEPKTRSSIRIISVPAGLMREAQQYLNALEDVPERVFSFVTAERLRFRMRRYAEKAGLEMIGLHGLRHSHASFLINHHVPVTTISKRLGHSDPGMTLRVYSHMYASSDAEAAAKINDALFM